MANSFQDKVRTGLAWSTALGIFLIVLGIFALLAPFIAAVYAALILAWAVIFSGVAQLVHAFRTRREGHFILPFLVALLYLGAGLWLLLRPAAAVLSLTLLFGAMLIVSGVLQLMLGFRLRPAPGSGWLIFDGLLSLLLGIFVATGWPWTAAWVIGTYIGISLVFRGFGIAMFSAAARRALATA